jgi:hypothetical protein
MSIESKRKNPFQHKPEGKSMINNTDQEWINSSHRQLYRLFLMSLFY